jgi:cobaltochelatase CobS
VTIPNTLQQSMITVIPTRPNRETTTVSMRDTFKIETRVREENGQKVYADKQLLAFKEPGILTPAINPNYQFPKEELVEFLKALEHRDTTYLIGHSGSGKTELVNQVAARLNYNVVCINFDGHLSRGDLVGDWKIQNQQMVFRYGLVPLGFTEPGTIVLFDEIDACPPETAFVLQRAISQELRFLMHETSEIFNLHPQNCIVGTANTNGMGDDSSLYIAGTNVQNFSFLNRWKTCIQIDYISPEAEEKVLKGMFTQPHATPYIASVVKVLAAVRDAFKSNTVSVPLTTRDGINWMEKVTRLPMPMKAARHSFLDKLPPQDAMAVAQVIQRYFKLPERDDRKYLSMKK